MTYAERYHAWVDKAERARDNVRDLERRLLSGQGVSTKDVSDAAGGWQDAVAAATMYGMGMLLEELRKRS